jgi:hypothetical protein
MHRSQTCPAVLLVLSLLLATTDMRAGNAELQAKLKGALANFQAVTPEILQDPKNADLLQELRLMAKDEQSAARVPLIKLGDDDVIRSCVERLHSDRKSLAMNQLIMAGNPKVIPLLVGDLNKEESADLIRQGDDQFIRPMSMTAAVIIKRIILKSPVFTSDLKAWAKPLPEFSVGVRSGIRAWWEANKAALLREDYAAVVVP